MGDLPEADFGPGLTFELPVIRLEPQRDCFA
jgi:hypothetical protein